MVRREKPLLYMKVSRHFKVKVLMNLLGKGVYAKPSLSKVLEPTTGEVLGYKGLLSIKKEVKCL